MNLMSVEKLRKLCKSTGIENFNFKKKDELVKEIEIHNAIKERHLNVIKEYEDSHNQSVFDKIGFANENASDLRQIDSKMKIKGFSKMKKEKLLEAIKNAKNIEAIIYKRNEIKRLIRNPKKQKHPRSKRQKRPHPKKRRRFTPQQIHEFNVGKMTLIQDFIFDRTDQLIDIHTIEKLYNDSICRPTSRERYLTRLIQRHNFDEITLKDYANYIDSYPHFRYNSESDEDNILLQNDIGYHNLRFYNHWE